MALQKDTDTVYGVIGNYHKIVKLDVNTMNWSAIVVVSVWKDEQARDDDKSPLKADTFELPSGSMNPIIASNNSCMIEIAYDWIKDNIEFYYDAIDV